VVVVVGFKSEAPTAANHNTAHRAKQNNNTVSSASATRMLRGLGKGGLGSAAYTSTYVAPTYVAPAYTYAAAPAYYQVRERARGR
jgi:hypothetical protein